VSDSTAALIPDPPAGQITLKGVTLEDLGPLRIRDIPGSRHVFCARHPDLPAYFPPLTGAAGPLGNLPAPLTSFVGRQRESADVAKLLGDAHVVTIVATSGTGKTRLALEVARTVRDRFADGAWLVDLSELPTPVDSIGAVASALGVPDVGDEAGIATALARYLAGRDLLLVLDSCERVAGVLAALVDQLARGAPGLRILATSQSPLHAVGEVVYRLQPLTVPATMDDPAAAESVQLFVERARSVRASFDLDGRSAPAVARICRQLDGIPFAIELAAARAAAFTAAQLADRLEESFKIPLPSSAPLRHATLRGAVAWSHDLLDATEQSILARLSVFSGDCTLEAAETLCSRDDMSPVEVMGGLASLVDKSLVVVVFDDHDEHPAYRLLQMVRAFAAERLSGSGESASMSDRHLEFFMGMAEEASHHLTGPEQGRMEDLLEADFDNLRAAFLHALTKVDGEPSMRLANATWRFLEDRGHWRDWERWFEGALGHGGFAPPPVHAWALANGSVVAERLGELPLCEERARAAVEMFTVLDDEAGASFALSFLGNSAMDRGEIERAVPFFETALAMRERQGDRRGVAVSLANLGKARYEGGDYAGARPAMERALAILEEVGDRARVVTSLGEVAQVSLAVGDVEAAFVHAARGVDEARRAGYRHLAGWNTALLGRVLAVRGRTADAIGLLAEALEVLVDLGDDRSVLSVLGDLALIVTAGDPLVGVELLSAVRAIRERHNLPPDVEDLGRYDAADAAADAGLSPDSLKLARTRGVTMEIEQAVRRVTALAGLP
jgi:predicted ATPase